MLLGGVARLALQITKTGARSWVFRYRQNGRRREAGLGAYPDVLLAKAHQYAREARGSLRKGTDLLEERNAEKFTSSLSDKPSINTIKKRQPNL